MCGIIGKISRQKISCPLEESDLDLLKHRGPDDQGIYNDDYASLGHCRLSIIDLSSAGHQPMHAENKRYSIVYNGEVYNYLEIRERLQSEGVSFQTQSDTEVVLKSYIHWGAPCLQQFRGMFAFAIWDQQDQKLFMARDRCGEKPFIYFIDENSFYFSSEFKALIPLLPEMPRITPSVADMYMHYQYTPEPYTLLENVHKIPAAHYAVLDVRAWSLEIQAYWDLFSIKADSAITKEDIREELEKAVKFTLRSDVQVGIALSAGIDSAGIAAIASKYYPEPMQAFCVGYPGRPTYDERSEAKNIAKLLGCHFNEVELATDEFVDGFTDFALLMDEPVADIAAFGHYAVPKACADKNIKVLLTGIGGDELFWGYDWTRAATSLNENKPYLTILAQILGPFMCINSLYKLLFAMSRTRKIPVPFRDFCRQLLACIESATPDDQLIFMAASGAPEFTKKMKVKPEWHGPALKDIDTNNAYIPTQTDKKKTSNDIPTTIMDLLFKTWLTSNCLSLGDRVSMAVGVETRLPFLDVGLIEKVVAWRKNKPDHKNGQKAVLREILTDLLPEATINRRKSGFVPPVMQWISGIIRQYGDRLQTGCLIEQGIITLEISQLLNSSKLGPHTLYRLILLEIWYSGLANLRRDASGA